MKLRVVSSRSEISRLNSNEKLVHMAFRASNVDFLNLMQKCPKLRVIQVPPSYHKTMSNAIQAFMDIQGIELLEGDVWGHRKDLDEYYVVDESILNEIKNLTSTGLGISETASKIQKRTKLAPDLIKYIAKGKSSA
jgi:hypothetical protein